MINNLRRMTRFVLSCICAVSLASLVGFIPFTFIGNDIKRRFDHVKFPLRGFQDVIVDGQDRVYVGIRDWARILVFDRSGKFLYGFSSRSYDYGGRMGFDDDGNLLVTLARSDTIYVYSLQGQKLATRTGGLEYNRQWKPGRPCSRDSLGDEYQIRHPSINPTIVKVAPDGTEEVFLATPWYLWPFVAPVPCIISIVVASVAYKLLSRKSHDTPEEPAEGFAKTWQGSTP